MQDAMTHWCSKFVLTVLIGALVANSALAGFAGTTTSTSPVAVTQSEPDFLPLIVKKELSTNRVATNDSIIVMIQLINLNDAPIYDIELTEPKFISPIFNYTGLDNPVLVFGQIEADGNRSVFYLLRVGITEPINITLFGTSVKYYLEPSSSAARKVYTSLSAELEFRVAQKVDPTTEQKRLLVLVSFILALYTFLMIAQGLIRFLKPKKKASDLVV